MTTLKTTTPPVAINERRQVRHADTRADERWVSVTTHWIHSTAVYLVAEVDGLSCLVGRVSVTQDPARARKAANRLVDQLTEPEPEPASLNTRRPKPRATASGRWKATTTHRGREHSGTFDTKAAAEAFIDKIKEG